MSDEGTPVRSLIIRPRASDDIEREADYLEEHASPKVAARFRSAIIDTIERILFMPGIGSLRRYSNPIVAGLRMTLVSEFNKYLVFYLTPEGNIDIVRVLHSSQDIDAILEAETE